MKKAIHNSYRNIVVGQPYYFIDSAVGDIKRASAFEEKAPHLRRYHLGNVFATTEDAMTSAILITVVLRCIQNKDDNDNGTLLIP